MEAVASTPAAKWGRYPPRVISGMVNAPVVTALAMALPLMVPKRAEVITATFAAPPLVHPASPSARSVNTWINPMRPRKAPKSTKR